MTIYLKRLVLFPLCTGVHCVAFTNPISLPYTNPFYFLAFVGMFDIPYHNNGLWGDEGGTRREKYQPNDDDDSTEWLESTKNDDEAASASFDWFILRRTLSLPAFAFYDELHRKMPQHWKSLLNWFECTKKQIGRVCCGELGIFPASFISVWVYVNAFRSLKLNYKPKQLQMSEVNEKRHTEPNIVMHFAAMAAAAAAAPTPLFMSWENFSIIHSFNLLSHYVKAITFVSLWWGCVQHTEWTTEEKKSTHTYTKRSKDSMPCLIALNYERLIAIHSNNFQ